MINKILYPLKQIRLAYVPLMVVYFATGFSALTGVANTFFMKEGISLTASEQVSLSIWVLLPWSIKMVFGALIDGFKLFGNNRKSYIYLGSLFIALSAIGMADHASGKYLIGLLGGEYAALLLTGLIGTIGVVMADIVADTMAIEITDDQKEQGIIQVLSRLSFSFGSVAASAITGYLAANYPHHIVFMLQIVCPILTIVATLLTKINFQAPITKLNKPVLLGGILFGAFSLLSGLFFGDYSQLIIFLVSLVVIVLMLKNIIQHMDKSKKYTFIFGMTAIFLFRVVPGVGPGGIWYFIEEHGFDANFLGVLRLVGNLASFVIMWLLTEKIAETSLFKTMLTLTVLATVFSLPEIMIYYDVHAAMGLSAKSLSITDTAFDAPIVGLSMLPLGILVARNAPAQQRAIYMSLTASLMNASLVGGELITKFLNDVYPITRNDFGLLGQLMIASLAISTLLSASGLWLLKKGKDIE